MAEPAGRPFARWLAAWPAKAGALLARSPVSPASALAGLVALLLVARVAVVLVGRLRYGVDFSDEAFYVALPYRFAIGDRPFVDEISPAQTAALITTPLFWSYLKISGGTAGIILFSRWSYLAFSALVGLVVFSTLRRVLSWPLALATATIGVAYVPFCVFSLSYNTLSMGFFTAGCFLTAGSLLGRNGRGPLILAGVALGLATLAYPTLLPAVVVTVLSFTIAAPGGRRERFVLLTAGGLLVVLAAAPFFVEAGMDAIATVYRYSNAVHDRPPAKLLVILENWAASSPLSLWSLAGVLAGFGWVATRPGAAFWLMPIVAGALAISTFTPKHVAGPWMIVYAGLLAPGILLTVGDDPKMRLLFRTIWFPSFVAGILNAISSSNGGMNAGLGLLPAAILLFTGMALAAQRAAQASARATWGQVAAMATPVVLVLGFLSRVKTVYRDHHIEQLTERVRSGPFRGLDTIPAKAGFITDLQRELARHERRDGRIIFFHDFPAGFLFTRMRPALNTVWPVDFVDQSFYLEAYKQRRNGAGLGVKMRQFPGRIFPVRGGRTTALEGEVENNDRLLVDIGTFAIYEDPKPTP